MQRLSNVRVSGDEHTLLTMADMRPVVGVKAAFSSALFYLI